MARRLLFRSHVGHIPFPRWADTRTASFGPSKTGLWENSARQGRNARKECQFVGFIPQLKWQERNAFLLISQKPKASGQAVGFLLDFV